MTALDTNSYTMYDKCISFFNNYLTQNRRPVSNNKQAIISQRTIENEVWINPLINEKGQQQANKKLHKSIANFL